MGQPVKLEATARGRGLKMCCPNPAHNGHSRYRSILLDVQLFGPRAAEYFFGAWYMNAREAAHRDPTRAEVREFIDTYGEMYR